MINSVQGLVYESSQPPCDVVMDENFIYYTTSQSSLKKFDQNTLTNTLTVIASSSTCTGVALFSAASAVMVFNTTNVRIVDTSTGTSTLITSNAAATQRNNAMQQVATNQTTLLGIATKSTTGSVTLINANNSTCTSLTVSTLSGVNATCVIPKTDGSNFLIGSSDGRVHEIDTSGTVIKSLTLPVTNRYGGALSSLQVGSMSYYNNYLLVSDTGGLLDSMTGRQVLTFSISISVLPGILTSKLCLAMPLVVLVT